MTLALVVVAALVLAATILVRSDFSGAGDADVVELDSESSAYRIPLPGSPDDLSANADIVVVAQAIERGAETDVLGRLILL